MKLRVLDAEWPERPSYNLSVEESVAANVDKNLSPNTLRFWRNENTVVIGRFQCPVLEVNVRECLRFGTCVVRRFTGGGAVYHDLGNLNYAISVRKNSFPADDVSEAFELVGNAVVGALEALGVDAEFRPINDVEIDGRKVSGLAGTVLGNAYFVHGSLLVGTNLDVLARVLRTTEEKFVDKFTKSVRKRVVTLGEVVGEVSMDDVKLAMVESFSKLLGAKAVRGGLTESEKSYAKELLNGKYGTLHWHLETCRFCSKCVGDLVEIEKIVSLR